MGVAALGGLAIATALFSVMAKETAIALLTIFGLLGMVAGIGVELGYVFGSLTGAAIGAIAGSLIGIGRGIVSGGVGGVFGIIFGAIAGVFGGAMLGIIPGIAIGSSVGGRIGKELRSGARLSLTVVIGFFSMYSPALRGWLGKMVNSAIASFVQNLNLPY